MTASGDKSSTVKKLEGKITADERLSESDRQIILEFVDAIYTTTPESTIQLYVSNLRSIATNIDGASLNQLTVSDVDDILNWLKNREIQEDTRRNYTSTLEQFLKWMGETDLVDYLGENSAVVAESKPEYPTEETVYELINATTQLRYRACFEFLWLTGAKVSECKNVRLADIVEGRINSEGMSILSTFEIDVPKGDSSQQQSQAQRRIPTEFRKEQAPHLVEWYMKRKQGHSLNQWLWIDDQSKEQLSGEQIRYQLSNTANRTSIGQKITPRKLRQARAVHLVRHGKVSNTEELRTWFGWSEKTNTAQKYWNQGVAVTTQENHSWSYCSNCEAAFSCSVQNCYRCGEEQQIPQNTNDSSESDLQEFRSQIIEQQEQLHQELLNLQNEVSDIKNELRELREESENSR